MGNSQLMLYYFILAVKIIISRLNVSSTITDYHKYKCNYCCTIFKQLYTVMSPQTPVDSSEFYLLSHMTSKTEGNRM